MNLFINAISQNGVFILFDEKRNIITKQDIQIYGNESSQFIQILDNFLSENNINYHDIQNIVCVNGPGSFTGIRTIILAVNTIAYSTKQHITPLSYFELFRDFPIIKSSSKKDSFFQIGPNQDIQILKNDDILDLCNKNNYQTFFGESNSNIFEGLEIIEKIDYSDIIQNVELKKMKQIDPLYIKKPNIS